MKYFCPDGRGLFQDDSKPPPVHRERRLAERFDKDENDVNHKQYTSHSPDLKLIKHLREILERGVRQRSPPVSSKHQLKEYILEE